MSPPTQKVSDAARQFVENAEPIQVLSLDEIEIHRAEEHKESVHKNKAIIATYVEELTQEDIGGIRSLLVTPKSYDIANEDRCVLYFFGGAFVVGSPDVDLPIIARLASRLGIKVVAPYYRRAPEYQCPAAINDGLAAYRALLDSYSHDRVAIVGESAGGNLSLSVALHAREQGSDLPAAIVLMSPWCDVTPTGETQQKPTGFDPTLDYELQLKESAAAYAGQFDQKDPRVSPLYADYSVDFPSTLITTGTRELFLSDCKRLETVLRQSGVDVTLRIWDGMWHVFEWYADIPEADQSIDEIADFIQTAFG